MHIDWEKKLCLLIADWIESSSTDYIFLLGCITRKWKVYHGRAWVICDICWWGGRRSWTLACERLRGNSSSPTAKRPSTGCNAGFEISPSEWNHSSEDANQERKSRERDWPIECRSSARWWNFLWQLWLWRGRTSCRDRHARLWIRQLRTGSSLSHHIGRSGPFCDLWRSMVIDWRWSARIPDCYPFGSCGRWWTKVARWCGKVHARRMEHLGRFKEDMESR